MTDSIFGPAELQRLVTETIPAETGPAHRLVVVGGVDQTGAQILAVFKRAPHPSPGCEWELDVAYRHTWAGDDQVGARVLVAF